MQIIGFHSSTLAQAPACSSREGSRKRNMPQQKCFWETRYVSRDDGKHEKNMKLPEAPRLYRAYYKEPLSDILLTRTLNPKLVPC